LRRDVALVAVPANERPAPFASWPADTKQRCRTLWSSIGNRNASRTEWLYAREVPDGVAIPAAATIRTWAREESWSAWADADLDASHGKTLRELQTGWLSALKLSQETLIDAMCGRLDDLPYAGAARVRAAEVVAKLIAQSGLLAVAPEPEAQKSRIDWSTMSLEEQEAYLSQDIRRRKQRG
jgi:hypothetical protein